MAEIVNLRQVRKRKAREESELAAARNRALHGRTRAQRERDRQAEERSRALLDGHFRAPSPPSEED